VKKYPGIIAAAGIGLLSMVFISCPEVMSTSWGRWAKREPKIPPITTGNIDSLLDATVGDPEFAEALLEAIRDEIPHKKGEEKAVLQGAAITAAANGSGLDMAVIAHIGDLLDAAAAVDDGLDGENAEKITETFNTIFTEADHKNALDLAEDLTAVLLEDTTTYDSTQYWEDPSVTTDSLLLSTVLLLIAEADAVGNFTDYLEDFQARRESGGFLSDTEKAILILVKEISKREGGTFDVLLDGLKLNGIDNINSLIS
jgi:hypothetical protein